MHVLKNVEAPQIRLDIPEFNAGDTIRVQVKVIEGEKERLQAFQGVVISRRGAGLITPVAGHACCSAKLRHFWPRPAQSSLMRGGVRPCHREESP